MAKILRRKLKIAGQAKPESASDREARTAIRYILDNPFYSVIIRAIRQGQPNSKIAEFCISRGYMNVNQKTAISYLQYFRSRNPQMCRPVEPEEGPNGIAGYDHLFNGNETILDEETELLRLISLQKARIGINFQNERNVNALLATGGKEVEQLRELLIALARLRGRMNGSMDINVHGYSETVKDDLRSIKQDEQQRNMLATLVGQLAEVQTNG